MKIEQTIINTLTLSTKTKIPVLFLSNPGLGKTTILQRYAKKNGMHLETLIGSRYSPEDITGYQVNNGGDSLQHLNPEWFKRILQKKEEKIPTLLFIDELSTCSEAVQGPLLSLIFDRTIGNEKYLPDDCVIVSAANYSANLSSFMNIISPTLNRFCIINLNDGFTAKNLVDEFLDKVEITYPGEYTPLDDNDKEYFQNKYKDFWLDTFTKYSDKNSPNGYLDINNKDIGGIYQNTDGNVYNFISGRSLSYLRDMLQAYIEYDLKDTCTFNHIIDGLVGNGSCNFLEAVQRDKFREYVCAGMKKLINRENRIKQDMIFTGNLSKDIASFIVNKDNLNTTATEDLQAIVMLTSEVTDKFQLEKVIEASKNPDTLAALIADYESLVELQQYVSNYPDSKDISHQISKIAMDYYGLYCDIIGTTPDFKETFGVSNNLFQRVCFLRTLDNHKNPVFVRAAKRAGGKHCHPSLYKIKNDDCILETVLDELISPSESYQVLIYDNGFKYRSLDRYLSTIDKAA